jgi:glucosamine-6-phosphate deaminase
MKLSETRKNVPTDASKSVLDFEAETARVLVFDSVDNSAAAAAVHAVKLITEAVREKDSARIIAATGNSQKAFIDHLVKDKDVPWDRVTLFHMDEYVGISDKHAASFRLWIRTRIEQQVHPKEADYVHGDVDLSRYSSASMLTTK